MIRNVGTADAPDICRIYNEYVLASTITFEENPVSESEMESRISEVTKEYPWLVFEADNKVVGYTYARRWRDRAAYKHSVETGTYLDANYMGKGIGTELKKAMIDELKKRSFHSVIAGIALPNPASIALSEKFGFAKVAHFKEVGYKMGKWIDVGYWELLL